MANEIISYREMCDRERTSLQRGMNYQLGGSHSVVLMSRRQGAPYSDTVVENGTVIIYEGHDVPRTNSTPKPKTLDQSQETNSGRLTQNGLFFAAALEYKQRKRSAEPVKVYEKIRAGIWTYNGLFRLTDAWKEDGNGRQVYKFRLEVDDTDMEPSRDIQELEHARVIPSSVKLEVWQRDQGKCIECGAEDNLHFDHIIPYSKGGTSLRAENIQLLCARHNLEKRDQIK